jgi:hypothetical protein
MPSSAEMTHDAIVSTVIALERSCLEADAALVERRWPDLESTLRVQAELTAELARLFEAAPQLAPANDPKVERRINGIVAYREDQLRRLRAYRDETASRLSSIGKVNAFARSFGKRSAAAQLLDGQY